MELVKMGKKGQAITPKGILRALSVRENSPLLVEATGDGGIMLRPAAVYLFEMYSDERIAEFERENAAPAALLAKVDRVIAKKKRR